MGLRHGCLFHDRQAYEGLEALHSVDLWSTSVTTRHNPNKFGSALAAPSVDVLTFVRQVIILRFIQECAVSDIGVSHNDKRF